MVANQGGRRARMAAAAHLLCDGADIDGVGGAARDELDAVAQIHQQEQAGRIVDVAQRVGQGADLVLIVGRNGRRDDDGVSGDRHRLTVLGELGVQLLLRRGQRMVQEAASTCMFAPCSNSQAAARRSRGVVVA